MASASSPDPSPQQGYGLITLTALVVTGMIGSGVFTTSGFALESLGSPQAVLAERGSMPSWCQILAKTDADAGP